MKNKIYLVLSLVLSINFIINAQDDSTTIQLQKFQVLLKQLQQNRFEDSLKKAELQYKYNLLKSNESLEKERVQAEFRAIEVKDSLRKADMIARANYLKKSAIGYPVTLNSDTLFKIYTKIGASTPKERAVNVTKRIKKLYDDDFFKPDSLISVGSENTVDIVYGDLIVVSISELDALINNSTNALLAKKYVTQIKNAISVQKEKNGVLRFC